MNSFRFVFVFCFFLLFTGKWGKVNWYVTGSFGSRFPVHDVLWPQGLRHVYTEYYALVS